MRKLFCKLGLAISKFMKQCQIFLHYNRLKFCSFQKLLFSDEFLWVTNSQSGIKIWFLLKCTLCRTLPIYSLQIFFKGCGMGPWLVLVSPCFRENVVATFKIGSFLCGLDNLLQKNVVVFFFGNQISKWRSFEKRAIFGLLFSFFSHQGKVTKIPSVHISLTYIHVFCSPYWLFLPYQVWKKY